MHFMGQKIRASDRQARLTGCGHPKVEQREVLIGQEGQQHLGLAVWDPCCQPCVKLQTAVMFQHLQQRSAHDKNEATKSVHQTRFAGCSAPTHVILAGGLVWKCGECQQLASVSMQTHRACSLLMLVFREAVNRQIFTQGHGHAPQFQTPTSHVGEGAMGELPLLIDVGL